jgi:hypothetical protein
LHAQRKRGVGLRRSEFLHLAPRAVRDETGSVGIPLVAVKAANPLGIRVAVLADVNGARSDASVIAALVSFHVLEGLPFVKLGGYAETVVIPRRSAISG